MTVMEEPDVVEEADPLVKLQRKFADAMEQMDSKAVESEAVLYPLLEEAGRIHDEWMADGEEAFWQRVENAGIVVKARGVTPKQNYTLQVLYGSEHKRRKRRISEQAQAMAAYEGLLHEEKIKLGFSMQAWLERKEWFGTGKKSREFWGIGKGKKLFPKLNWVKLAKAEAKSDREADREADAEAKDGYGEDEDVQVTARAAARLRSFQKALLDPIHPHVIVEGKEGAAFLKEHKLTENRWAFAVVDLRGGAVKLLRVLPDKVREQVTRTLFRETGADKAPLDGDDLDDDERAEDAAEDQAEPEREIEYEEDEAEAEHKIEYEEDEPEQDETDQALAPLRPSSLVIVTDDEEQVAPQPTPEVVDGQEQVSEPEVPDVAPTRSTGFFSEVGSKVTAWVEPSFSGVLDKAPEVVSEDRITERIEQITLTIITKAGKDGCNESEIVDGLNVAGVKANRAQVRRGLVWLVDHEKKVEQINTKYFLAGLAGLASKKRSRK